MLMTSGQFHIVYQEETITGHKNSFLLKNKSNWMDRL